MSTEDCNTRINRKAFEEWAAEELKKRHGGHVPDGIFDRRGDEDYASVWLSGAWASWQHIRPAGVSYLRMFFMHDNHTFTAIEPEENTIESLTEAILAVGNDERGIYGTLCELSVVSVAGEVRHVTPMVHRRGRSPADAAAFAAAVKAVMDNLKHDTIAMALLREGRWYSLVVAEGVSA